MASYNKKISNQSGIKFNEVNRELEGGGNGSSLPEVTSADNGDFLRVVNGEWSKSTVPSAESEEY